MPFGLIPFLLLIVPILEIAVFILLGGQIGVIATLGLILLTAIVGTILLRVQGLSTLTAIQAKLHSGEPPAEEMISGVMILVAGILLLTPGFVTDICGFLLFFPPLRKLIWRSVASKVVIQRSSTPHPRDPRRPAEPDVVDLDPSEFSEQPNPGSPWGDKHRD